MTQVSKRMLDKELSERIFEFFIKIVSDLKNPKDVESFIKDILSPTEKIMLSKRLAIAVLLSKGYTYENIDNILKVSSPTIMTVSYFLKNGDGGYQKAVNKIFNMEKKEELVDKIEEILLQLSGPKRYESPAYEQKRKRGKELVRRRSKRSTL